jgi:uncharacterized protein
VPRFHITWGTGPAVLAPFERAVRAAAGTGQVRLLFRHQVDELTLAGGTVTGVRGSVLARSGAARGQASSREVTGDFELRAQAVLVTSGGIGGNHELVRKYWPARLGPPPGHLLSGVPAHVDGRMLDISAAAGAAVINPDRMWHYTEGITNWAPIWPEHGIRILPGPSSLWLDARGRPLPRRCSPVSTRSVPGLYAAGEVAGFGGGGMHGYRALEGTFLGGCLFSGRIAGRRAARALA